MYKKIRTWFSLNKFVFICILLIIFPLLLALTGTLTSGWHLIDDHETYRIVELNVNQGIPFWDTLKQYMSADMKIRWRPLYWVFRISSAYLFGFNSFIPNMLLCFLGMVTYGFLYGTAKNLSCSAVGAHAFSLLIIAGRQYEIWYRIANQENIALFLFAVCLYIITKQYRDNSYSNKMADGVLVVASIGCSMMKESFLILLPGIIFFRLFLEIIKSGLKPAKWYKLVLKHWILCGLTFAVFCVSIFIIFNYVGTNSIGYAGIEIEAGIKTVIWNVQRMIKTSLRIYVLLAVPLCLLVIISLIKAGFEKRKLYYLLVVGMFGFYIAAAEMVLYAQSGMWDRYLIPFMVGYGITFVILFPNLIKDKIVKRIYFLILAVFIGTRIWSSIFNAALPYGDEGKATQNLLSFVLANTDEESQIVTVLGEGESDLAVSIYLEFENRKNVYVYQEGINEWKDGYGSQNSISDTDNCDMFIMYTGSEHEKLEDEILRDNKWKKSEIGKWFIVWNKSDNG